MTTLPGLLQAAALRFPDRIAVRDDHGSLRYRELADSVHRLSRLLLATGCRKGEWVVCCLPRSVDAVVAQAAVMAAGAVYVPVDPNYPTALLSRMLDTGEPLHGIGDAAGIQACAAAAKQIVPLTLDADTARRLQTFSSAPPPVSLQAQDGAYVIHTSGSSGVPKAVLVSHGAIAASTLARWKRYADPVTAFLLVSPMFFDSSLAGIWWTLSQGGTLELAPADAASVIVRVRRALTEPDAGLSHTLLTPTLFGQILHGVQEAAPSLRHVIVAGEACPEALVRRHYALLPEVELVNEYGPTEAAVWCTSTVLRPGAEVTIGTPLPTVELLIVDAEGSAVAQGGVGELCIAGKQLAVGYPRDAALTAARFVPHATRPGERMYRTGDLARLLPDGRYSLYGRVDEQVKIRGFRVDLSGVRTTLAEHPGVAELALAMRTRPGSMGQVLTAYVVSAGNTDDARRRLRNAWKEVVEGVAVDAPARGTAFDTSGWNSSYTGKALPAAAMQEWVDSTTALLCEGDPVTVLDLGCGSGLPLLRVAPQCTQYVGLDPSEGTLAGVATAIRSAGLDAVVELQRGEAADIHRFAGQTFDLIVSNSVSQYFPGEDYLLDVIRAGLGSLAPGGRLVIGDVRDLSLLWEFHTAIVIARAPGETPAASLLAQVRQRVQDEAQLVISPEWFAALPDLLPGVDVEVRPRRGWDRNEMNDFRFDVVLRPETSVTRVEVPCWLDWNDNLADGDQVAQRLSAAEPLGIRHVPNARTAGISAVVQALQAKTEGTRSGFIAMRDTRDREALHPETAWQWAQQHGYHVYLHRGAAHDAGAYDAVSLPAALSAAAGTVLLPRFPRVIRPAAGPRITDPTAQRMAADASLTLLPALKQRASERLAPQERPGAYVFLPALPTTSRGKIDLAALPDPKPETLQSSEAFTAPTTPTEAAVAAVWSNLLGIDSLGIDDDFVGLGGDSLMAAVCSVSLSEVFHVPLPAGTLFQAPTIRRLAALIDSAQQEASAAPPLDELHSAEDARLPLTSAQTIFWFLDHYRRPGSARHPDFALSVHYRITGPLETAALRTAIDQLVLRHEALRTRVMLDAADGYQSVLAPPTGVLRVTCIEDADPEAVLDRAAQHDADIALDPAEGRVFSAHLTRASATKHLLVLRVHHIVSDGWSMNVMEADLEALYAAARQRLGELAVSSSYSGLTRHLDQTFFVNLDWRDREPYRSALAYWKEKARGVTPSVLRETGEPHAFEPTRQHSLDLDEEELAALLHAARQQGATLFAAVAAALACLRAQDSGDPDVRLLTLNAARDTAGVDRMIGLLLNPVLLRLSVEPRLEFAKVVASAAKEVRNALAHGQVPLLAMCEEIPDLMRFMTESQFVGVELLSPARGLHLEGCSIHRTDGFDDDFQGRRFELPIELLLVVRRTASSLRLTVLHDPAVVEDEAARHLLTRLREMLVTSIPMEANA